jgi:hypothetical protein
MVMCRTSYCFELMYIIAISQFLSHYFRRPALMYHYFLSMIRELWVHQIEFCSIISLFCVFFFFVAIV